MMELAKDLALWSVIGWAIWLALAAMVSAWGWVRNRLQRRRDERDLRLIDEANAGAAHEAFQEMMADIGHLFDVRVIDDRDSPPFVPLNPLSSLTPEIARGPKPFRGVDPSQIPDHAQSKRWEAVHLWSPYAKSPERHPWGLHCEEPPLAMQCPECDLKMPMLHHGRARACSYCGSRIQSHGARVYWWAEEVKP